MKTTIAVLVLLVVGVGTVYTQTPPTTYQIPPTDLPLTPRSTATSQAAPQKEATIEQLLDQIEKIRAQKAEIEKQEQAAVAEVRKRMVKQTERLNKLGLGAPAVPPTVHTGAAPDLPTIPPGAALPAPPMLTPQSGGR